MPEDWNKAVEVEGQVKSPKAQETSDERAYIPPKTNHRCSKASQSPKDSKEDQKSNPDEDPALGDSKR